MELKKIMELAKSANLTVKQKFEIQEQIDNLILSEFCNMSNEDQISIQQKLKEKSTV